jgi:hypothetical protein
MSDNPLDRIPSFDRISLRAVVVAEGEDPGPALAAAGISDPIELPVVFGEDPPDRSFGDGFTPNVAAVLEFDQSEEDESGPASGAPSSASYTHGSPAGAAGSSPAATNLPSAYDIQPLAPVPPHGKTRRNTNRSGRTPPNLSVFPGTASSSPGAHSGFARSAIGGVQPPVADC